MKETPTYNFSFRCHYPGSDPTLPPPYTQHRQRLKLTDLPKWIECYRFTHPDCESISVKIWFTELPAAEDFSD